jgi:tol-pal system protein YbgF
MLRIGALVVALGLGLPGIALAQDTTLADLRQELSTLYIDIQNLKSELTASGALTQGTTGNTPLERLDSIEAQLQALTSKTEELEFRINRITVDGTNRIGDLEFRICELEEGCDTSALGDTPSLGGVDNGATVPQVSPETPANGDLAVNEQADFDRAQGSLTSGDFRGAADQFTAFGTTYPGSPLSANALFGKGQALEAAGEVSNAARAYLESFSANTTGQIAPDALFKLGQSLGQLGQTADACVTLAEVGTRFPGAPAVLEAQSVMRNLGCP